MATLPTSTGRRRIAELDVLRAIACLLVLLQHKELHPALPKYGWLGVQLFFVLSGYLVAGLLFGEFQRYRDVKTMAFLFRRGLKLYPQYYVLLGVTVCVGAIWGPQCTWQQILSQSLFIQNYAPRIEAIGQTWSLAVEEHFYIGLALWMGWRVRQDPEKPFRGVPRLGLAIGVFCLLARALTVISLPYSLNTHVFPTHLRIDALFTGVVLAYYRFVEPERFAVWLSRPVGLALLSFATLGPTLMFSGQDPLLLTVGYSSATVGCAAVVLLALSHAERNPNTSRPTRLLAYIGAHSYGIYLWHWWFVAPTYFLFRGRAPLLEYMTYLILCFGAGIIFTRLIELPALHWRDRKLPSRAA